MRITGTREVKTSREGLRGSTRRTHSGFSFIYRMSVSVEENKHSLVSTSLLCLGPLMKRLYRDHDPRFITLRQLSVSLFNVQMSRYWTETYKFYKFYNIYACKSSPGPEKKACNGTKITSSSLKTSIFFFLLFSSGWK